MAEKERLDILLVDKQLVPSRERAKSLIMAGSVLINGMPETKPGTKIALDAQIVIKSPDIPYVSRGGLKLEKALKEFDISLEEKVCMDVGASTGGFTDCMLQSGAVQVYSIDVGYGQFAWKLRQDPRVVCLERTNIRYVTNEQVPVQIDFASIDVSFISLTKVLEPVLNLLSRNGQIVALIKPQFEAGREKVGKKGVVRDPAVHIEVIQKIVLFVKEHDLSILHLSFSPIKGPEGNIEYLIHISKTTPSDPVEDIDVIVQSVVKQAHDSL